MRFLLYVLCAIILATSASAQTAAPSSTPPAKLVVSGNVANSLSLGIDDLKRLPQQHLDDVRQIRSSTGSASGEQVRRYTGVLLRDVLAAAKPVERERHELRQSIVVVTASDGYKAIFSWSELYLSPIGEGALVIFERDGAPLAASEGPLALVSLRDLQPGPRHVKWLASIEIRRVTP